MGRCAGAHAEALRSARPGARRLPRGAGRDARGALPVRGLARGLGVRQHRSPPAAHGFLGPGCHDPLTPGLGMAIADVERPVRPAGRRLGAACARPPSWRTACARPRCAAAQVGFVNPAEASSGVPRGGRDRRPGGTRRPRRSPACSPRPATATSPTCPRRWPALRRCSRTRRSAAWRRRWRARAAGGLARAAGAASPGLRRPARAGGGPVPPHRRHARRARRGRQCRRREPRRGAAAPRVGRPGARRPGATRRRCSSGGLDALVLLGCEPEADSAAGEAVLAGLAGVGFVACLTPTSPRDEALRQRAAAGWHGLRDLREPSSIARAGGRAFSGRGAPGG
jgi:hypothetical protein